MKLNGCWMVVCSKKTMLILVILLFILFVPSLRNIALYPVWPYAWRELGLVDAITLRFFTQNHIYEVGPLQSCPRMFTTPVKLSDVDHSKLKTYSKAMSTHLREPYHYKYLPILTQEDKVSMIYLYMVLANALRQLGVDFFLVQGTLLGVLRHQGIIPWDDDMDITVSVKHWRRVQERLSCIEGFGLSVTTFMHWKFYHNSSLSSSDIYPFVDIFFYTENRDFLWAVSRSTSGYLVYAKKDTFPLTTRQFEGLDVPVPKNLGHALNVIFDVNTCQSRGMNHKAGYVLPDAQVSRVSCESLSYLYHMYHLD